MQEIVTMVKPAMTTAAEILARLDQLRDASGQHIHERVRCAQLLMRDLEWLKQFEGLDGALRYLEDDYFGDLCGAVTITQLFRILEHVPDPDEWKKAKYNLKLLLAVANRASYEAQEEKRRKEQEAEARRIAREREKQTATALPPALTEEEKAARKTERIHEGNESSTEGYIDDLTRGFERIAEEKRLLEAENATLKREKQRLEIENAQLRQQLEAIRKKKLQKESVES